jgi:putative transposase
MRIAGLQGVHRRRWRRHQPGTVVWEDRVQRRFHADRPDRLWFTDITRVYCAAVLDVYPRRIVGWSIADHLRTELVVDALQMACWRHRPAGTVVHSDRGAQPGFRVVATPFVWSDRR